MCVCVSVHVQREPHHIFLTGLSILDLTSTDNDVLSLQNIFKTWLHDCGTDSEHLHLSLPPSHGDLALTIKCDMQERLLDPCSIPPLGQHFVSVMNWVTL